MLPIEKNLIDLVWNEQPAGPKNQIITLDISFAGQTIKEKWTTVCAEMDEKNADTLIISALDEIACNYMLNISQNQILLFVFKGS